MKLIFFFLSIMAVTRQDKGGQIASLGKRGRWIFHINTGRGDAVFF